MAIEISRRVAEISGVLHGLASAEGDGVLWLAIDAAAAVNAEPLPECLQAEFDAPTAGVVRLATSRVGAARHPRWLPLDTSTAKGSFLLQDSIERALTELQASRLREGQGRRIAGWLVLSGALPDALLHWGRQSILRRPDGGHTLLRLHDPAVLWAVWSLLDQQQQSELLGPVATWRLVDPAGDLVALTSGGRRDSKVVWTDAQRRDIRLIRPLNAALREQAEWRVDGRPIADARDVAMSALRRAHAAGFDDPQDLAVYAAHALGMHPMFDQHPAVQRSLRGRQPGDRYTALIQSMDEQAWADVRAMATLH